MSENMTPWLYLAAAAVVILYLKGYIRLPSTAALSTKPDLASSITRAEVDPLDSIHPDVLGMAFARSKRREAENDVNKAIMDQAGKTIKEAFTAPFSVAAPPASESPK